MAAKLLTAGAIAVARLAAPSALALSSAAFLSGCCGDDGSFTKEVDGKTLYTFKMKDGVFDKSEDSWVNLLSKDGKLTVAGGGSKYTLKCSGKDAEIEFHSGSKKTALAAPPKPCSDAGTLITEKLELTLKTVETTKTNSTPAPTPAAATPAPTPAAATPAPTPAAATPAPTPAAATPAPTPAAATTTPTTAAVTTTPTTTTTTAAALLAEAQAATARRIATQEEARHARKAHRKQRETDSGASSLIRVEQEPQEESVDQSETKPAADTEEEDMGQFKEGVDQWEPEASSLVKQHEVHQHKLSDDEDKKMARVVDKGSPDEEHDRKAAQ